MFTAVSGSEFTSCAKDVVTLTHYHHGIAHIACKYVLCSILCSLYPSCTNLLIFVCLYLFISYCLFLIILFQNKYFLNKNFKIGVILFILFLIIIIYFLV